MVTIRIAKQGEDKEIFELFSHATDWIPYTEIKEITHCISDNEKGKVSLIIAEEDKKILGALKLHRPQFHIGKIGKVTVSPDSRGKGIGKNLYRAAIKIFDLEERRKITDSVVGENEAMKALLEKLNFKQEGCLEKHTPGKKNLYLYAYFIDEQKVPKLDEHIKFDIPKTIYMK